MRRTSMAYHLNHAGSIQLVPLVLVPLVLVVLHVGLVVLHVGLVAAGMPEAVRNQGVLDTLAVIRQDLMVGEGSQWTGLRRRVVPVAGGDSQWNLGRGDSQWKVLSGSHRTEVCGHDHLGHGHNRQVVTHNCLLSQEGHHAAPEGSMRGGLKKVPYCAPQQPAG